MAKEPEQPKFMDPRDEMDPGQLEMLSQAFCGQLMACLEECARGRKGLFEDQGVGIVGFWTVHLQYHWTQTFPAHSMVHIRHEYAPVIGFEMMPRETIDLFLMPANERQAAKYEYPPPLRIKISWQLLSCAFHASRNTTKAQSGQLNGRAFYASAMGGFHPHLG